MKYNLRQRINLIWWSWYFLKHKLIYNCKKGFLKIFFPKKYKIIKQFHKVITSLPKETKDKLVKAMLKDIKTKK